MAEMPPGLGPRLQLSKRVCRAAPAERARGPGAQTQLVSTGVLHPHRAPPSGSAPPDVWFPVLGRPRWPIAFTSPASLPRGPGRCWLLRSTRLDPRLGQFPEKPLGFRSRPRPSGLPCFDPTACSPRLAAQRPTPSPRASLAAWSARLAQGLSAWEAASATELPQPSAP